LKNKCLSRERGRLVRPSASEAQADGQANRLQILLQTDVDAGKQILSKQMSGLKRLPCLRRQMADEPSALPTTTKSLLRHSSFKLHKLAAS
jgi:hypothetical protein